MDNRSFTDVGGTPGGIGEFLIGFVMTCIGGYLISNQVSVVGSYWSFYGANTFGVTLVPMLLGVALLFILAGVIANMHIYFQPTTLFNTMVMLILLVGGLGLIARSIASHEVKNRE